MKEPCPPRQAEERQEGAMGVKYPKASKSAEIPPFLSVFTFSAPLFLSVFTFSAQLFLSVFTNTPPKPLIIRAKCLSLYTNHYF